MYEKLTDLDDIPIWHYFCIKIY